MPAGQCGQCRPCSSPPHKAMPCVYKQGGGDAHIGPWSLNLPNKLLRRAYRETLRLFQGFSYQMALRHGGHVYTYADTLPGDPTTIRTILRGACERISEENGMYPYQA